MQKVYDLWTYKPVQMALKSFGLGTACVGAMWAYGKLLPKDKTLDKLLETTDLTESLKETFRQIYSIDKDFLQMLDRLSQFRSFAKIQYDDLVYSTWIALRSKQLEYSKPSVGPSSSYRIRKEFQVVIEHVRMLRAVLEQSLPSCLEDFDEVAVDLNSKVEQICTDAIQDSC